MNPTIKLLLDGAVSGSKDEREALYEIVYDIEEYFVELICGLGFLSPEERDIIEENYPKFFFSEEVNTI